MPVTLAKVADFIDSQPYRTEVIVVENGSSDQTFAIAQQFAKQHSHFRALQEGQRGKGLAVKRGMLEARGDFRFMCDADLSMPLEEMPRFLPPALSSFDVAIGSREAVGAIRFREPLHRHLGGRLINLLIRLLILPGLHDTQCGFKCFRAPIAEALFSRQTLKGWSFDIELLFIARKLGYRIEEVPISWYFSPESKLDPARDAIRMALDIWKIRWNSLVGAYHLDEI